MLWKEAPFLGVKAQMGISDWSADGLPSRGFVHSVILMYNVPIPCFEDVLRRINCLFSWFCKQ